jgi:pentatricopeptide repeat protein
VGKKTEKSIQSALFDIQYEIARDKIKKGEYKNAEQSLRSLVKNHDNFAPGFFALAIACIAQFNDKDGEVFLKVADKLVPDAYHFSACLGHLHLLQRKLKDMEMMFKKTLKLNPSQGSVWNSFGFQQYVLSQFKDAEKSLTRAIELHPDNSDAVLIKGLSLSHRGKHREGRELIEKSKQMDSSKTPDHIRYMMSAPNMMKERRSHLGPTSLDPHIHRDAVIQIIQLMLQYENDFYLLSVRELSKNIVNIGFLNIIGKKLFDAGYYEESEDLFRKVLATDSNNISALRGLGYALSSQMKYSEAADILSKIVDVEQDSGSTHALLYGSLCRSGRFDEAEEILKEVAKEDLQSTEFMRTIGFEASKIARKEKIDSADNQVKQVNILKDKRVTSFEKPILLDFSLESRSWCWLYISCQSDKDIKTRELKVILNGDVKFAIPVDLFFMQRVDIGLVEPGKYSLELTMDTNARPWTFSVDHYSLPSNLLSKRKISFTDETMQSISSDKIDIWKSKYTELQTAPTKSDSFWYLYGRGLYRHGRLNEAIAAQKCALDLNPEHSSSRIALGLSFFLHGDIEEAIQNYRCALETKPLSRAAWAGLGIAVLELGSDDRLVELLEEISRLDLQIEVYQSWATYAFSLQKFEQCLMILKDALSRKPDYVDGFILSAVTNSRMGNHIGSHNEFEKACNIDDSIKDMDYQSLAHSIQTDSDGNTIQISPPRFNLSKYGNIMNFLVFDLENMDDFLNDEGYPTEFKLPENVESWLGRAETYRLLGWVPEALVAYERALEDCKDEPPSITVPDDLKDKYSTLTGVDKQVFERFVLSSKFGKQKLMMSTLAVSALTSSDLFWKKTGPTYTWDPKTGKLEEKEEE